MRKAKRGGDDLSRSFHKNRKACDAEWVSGRLRDGDSSQDGCTVPFDWAKSDFRKSVVSISLCNGDLSLFSCSGIAISRSEPEHRLTRILTSASLARALEDKTNERYFDLKIEVRHEGKEAYMGFMAEYDLDQNFVIVNVRAYLDVHVGIFQHVLESVPYGEACVIGRGLSGVLMARNVELGGDSRVSNGDKDLDSKTLEAWEGAIIFSIDGGFVGMNLFLVTGRAVFLPWSTVLKRLELYWTHWEKVVGRAPPENLKVYGFGAPPRGRSSSYPEDLLNQEQLDLDLMGYPKLPPTMLDAGMVLVNTFEETFGDTFGGGVWRKLSKKATSSMRRNVVALASFNGKKRLFACTGYFIDWNGSTMILTSASLIRNSGDESKIVENMRIEVLLPSKERKEGTLEHYNLHYNVALVSVKDLRHVRAVNPRLSTSLIFQVAAVGCCFESGELMSVSGKLVSWSGTLDCKFLGRSSCKITKAGIGGPLITLDGDVLGMNFYDKKIGTPFLSWHRICKILASFEGKSDISGGPFWKMPLDDTVGLNRWPVPMTYWCLPEDKPEVHDDGDACTVDYIMGMKTILC